MKTHAFLFMAHQQFSILRNTIELLDDERCDFYIHIDKKSDIKSEEISVLRASAKHSKVIFIDRISTNWGWLQPCQS